MYSLANKNVLVTGATGLVGMNILPVLLKEQANVFSCGGHKEYDLTNHDVIKDLFAKFKPDVVIHLAAQTSGAAVMEKTPLAHVTPNVVMNTCLLEEAYKSGVEKFVWLASTTGYPEFDGFITEERMFEGDPYHKYFAVGWMKRYTEKLCELYDSFNKMSCIVLRPTNIYGPHDKFDPERSHVLPALIRKVVEKQNPVEVWGDGKDIRDIVYVSDMVDAIILAIQKIDSYTPMNIGLGETLSVNEILDIIMRCENHNVPISHVNNKPSMIPKREVSIQKAKDLLGFEPKVFPQEGIQKTIEWYKNEYQA